MFPLIFSKLRNPSTFRPFKGWINFRQPQQTGEENVLVPASCALSWQNRSSSLPDPVHFPTRGYAIWCDSTVPLYWRLHLSRTIFMCEPRVQIRGRLPCCHGGAEDK